MIKTKKKQKERGISPEPTNCQTKQTHTKVLDSNRKQEREKRIESIKEDQRRRAAANSSRRQFKTCHQQTLTQLEQNVYFNKQS